MTTRPPTNPSTPDPSTARLAEPPEVIDSDSLVTTVMTRDVVTVAADARVPTAVHLMAAHSVRHLPVVDRGQCVGMLVETDLIRLLVKAPGPLRTADTLTVGELRRPSRELPPTARISDAARQMSLDASDAVLIIDQGHVLGIVTATDLVRMLAHKVS
jgi:CBS domain-containing protein